MTLLEEILAAFPGLTPANRDDGAIAAALSVGRTKTQNVAISDVQAYLQTNGLWWSIKGAAADAQHPANAAAIAVMDVANARYESLDMMLPIISEMLGGLVATGLMAQADQDELAGMGVVPDPVTPQDVSKALEGWVA